MKRKPPNLREKLASALLEVLRLRGMPIDLPVARAMTAEQIISLFQFDHDAGFACHGADNHPAGLTPLLIKDHREKTRRDISAIAKVNRLSLDYGEDFRARVLAIKNGEPVCQMPARKAKIANRGFPTKQERQAMKERYGKREKI